MYRSICISNDGRVQETFGTAQECYKHCVPADLSHVHLKLLRPVLRELETSAGPVLVSYNEGEPVLWTAHIERVAPKIEPPTQDGEQSSTSQGTTASKND